MEYIQEAVAYIEKKIDFKPQLGIILGTGLGSLVDHVEVAFSLNYSEIPHFPVSTGESHSGKLIFGKLSGKEVVIMQGRFHFYEGYSMKQVTFPVRVMKVLGIKKLFISNAAGSLNPEYKISDLMIINDHINLFPENPLTGANLDALGGRFPDMSHPYDIKMTEQALSIVNKYNIGAHQGVYVGVSGPNLETKAEYKYLRIIGADAVGMSTIPENIVARHMNLPVFAVSVITDICTPGNIKEVTVAEIIKAAKNAEPALIKLISEMAMMQ